MGNRPQAELVPASKAVAGREWLEKDQRGSATTTERLTPEILERQVRCTTPSGTSSRSGEVEFGGSRANPATNNFGTTDIAEAF